MVALDSELFVRFSIPETEAMLSLVRSDENILEYDRFIHKQNRNDNINV